MSAMRSYGVMNLFQHESGFKGELEDIFVKLQ